MIKLVTVMGLGNFLNFYRYVRDELSVITTKLIFYLMICTIWTVVVAAQVQRAMDLKAPPC